jgi:hypothetical protein
MAVTHEPAQVREVGHVEEYHVCLNGRKSLCDCKGFFHAGHCKHVDGLSALAAAGKIPGPAIPTESASEPIPE